MIFMTFHILGIINPTDSYFSEGQPPTSIYFTTSIDGGVHTVKPADNGDIHIHIHWDILGILMSF